MQLSPGGGGGVGLCYLQVSLDSKCSVRKTGSKAFKNLYTLDYHWIIVNTHHIMIKVEHKHDT